MDQRQQQMRALNDVLNQIKLEQFMMRSGHNVTSKFSQGTPSDFQQPYVPSNDTVINGAPTWLLTLLGLAGLPLSLGIDADRKLAGKEGSVTSAGPLGEVFRRVQADINTPSTPK